MISKIDRKATRQRRHLRVRRKISGTAECPRLCVYRSNTNLYAQIIDDVKGVTLASSSSLELKEKACNIEVSTKVGKDIAVGVASGAAYEAAKWGCERGREALW